MSRFDDWNPPLEHMVGGPARLLGIDIYHDFKWSDVVTHGMRQFTHGLRLAELANANCGTKTPALILTTNEHELEGAFETDTHHFIVVCLPRYLRRRNPTKQSPTSHVELMSTRHAWRDLKSSWRNRIC